MAATILSPSEGDVRPAVMTSALYREGARTVIVVRGEADISNRRVLSEVLARVVASEAGDVVIDLAETTFIDTAAGRVLATGHQLLDRDGRKLTFRSPSRLAARVLDLFGLTDSIEVLSGSQI